MSDELKLPTDQEIKIEFRQPSFCRAEDGAIWMRDTYAVPLQEKLHKASEIAFIANSQAVKYFKHNSQLQAQLAIAKEALETFVMPRMWPDNRAKQALEQIAQLDKKKEGAVK